MSVQLARTTSRPRAAAGAARQAPSQRRQRREEQHDLDRGRDAFVQRYERPARPQVSIRDRHEIVTLSCAMQYTSRPELYDLEYSFKDYADEVATLERDRPRAEPERDDAARRRVRHRQAPRAPARDVRRARERTSTKGCCASPASACPACRCSKPTCATSTSAGRSTSSPASSARSGSSAAPTGWPRRRAAFATPPRIRAGSRSSSRGSRPRCGCRTTRTCSRTRSRTRARARHAQRPPRRADLDDRDALRRRDTRRRRALRRAPRPLPLHERRDAKRVRERRGSTRRLRRRRA